MVADYLDLYDQLSEIIHRVHAVADLVAHAKIEELETLTITTVCSHMSIQLEEALSLLKQLDTSEVH